VATNRDPTAASSRSTKDRARDALIARLRELLSPERAALIDETGRTESFDDNLVPSLSGEQIEELKHQLRSGDGRELNPGKNGERPDGHAAHSSPCLAFNVFGPWLGRERQLVIDGVGGFTERLRVEAKQHIFRLRGVVASVPPPTSDEDEALLFAVSVNQGQLSAQSSAAGSPSGSAVRTATGS
jgi:hypothetical protein